MITGKGWSSCRRTCGAPSTTPEFQSLLATDPAKVMPDVRQPLLIVQGELDTQVEPANADRLEALARKRKNAPPVEVVKVPGVNHLLVPATTGEVDEYADAERQARQRRRCTQAIVTWLKKTLSSRALAIARAVHRVARATRPVWPTATLDDLRAGARRSAARRPHSTRRRRRSRWRVPPNPVS